MQQEPGWLAHSARKAKGIAAQPYCAHVSEVERMTAANLQEAALFATEPHTAAMLQQGGSWSSTFHDLGKLEEGNQGILQGQERTPLSYPHESAGALHCLEQGQRAAAWLIHSHHQGLTDYSAELALAERAQQGNTCSPFMRDEEGLLSQTQALLPTLLARNASSFPGTDQRSMDQKKLGESHVTPFQMRLLLSALVDADHGDTARNYGEENTSTPPEPRWAERLQSLDQYISGLGRDQDGRSKESKRDPLRRAVYEACSSCATSKAIYACDAPVGSGKTTAVMAYLLRAAIANDLRRIFVVLPFTNIINQSVDVYRKCLVLPREDPEQVVAAHHHATEFRTPEARGLTTLWRSPIIVTTAVQFFETLAACATPRLRKLHALPGSAVFIDEAHAAMPLHLWPLMWDQLEMLGSKWRCRFVLGSGSLPKLWKNTRLFAGKVDITVPSMLPEQIEALGAKGEKERVQVRTRQESQSLDSLYAWIKGLCGNRLVVMNTLQSAAALAQRLKDRGVQVLHLSTALTPIDRDEVIARVRRLLTPEFTPPAGWVLVATSCIEAGVDVSFDIALRERSSVSSLIQISGRVNRNGNGPRAEVWDFMAAADPAFTMNPALEHSRKVVEIAFKENRWEMGCGALMTWAIAEEWKRGGNDDKAKEPREKEKQREFVAVAGLVKLIDDASGLAVVDKSLIVRLQRGELVKRLDLIRGSVSIRHKVIRELSLTRFRDDEELYIWPDGCYDFGFLGIMSYVLQLKSIAIAKLAMV